MLKKIMSLLLVVLLCFGFCGCSNLSVESELIKGYWFYEGEMDSSDYNYRITFYEDGSVDYSYNVVLFGDDGLRNEAYSWKIEGQNKVIIYSNYQDEFTKELNYRDGVLYTNVAEGNYAFIHMQ